MTILATKVREVLIYDPDTGIFRWRITRGNRAVVGQIAGSRHYLGYIFIRIDGKLRYAHRLAWLHAHGVWPPEEIDHINGVRDDNRIVNLRLATSGQNKRNSRKPRHNTSGFKGVDWHKRSRKWSARIQIDGRRHSLGFFDDPAEAHEAYAEAAKKHFGKFAKSE